MAVQNITEQQAYDAITTLGLIPKSKPTNPNVSAESYIKQLLVDHKGESELWDMVLQHLLNAIGPVPTVEKKQSPRRIKDADEAQAYLADLMFIIPSWQELGLKDNDFRKYWGRLQQYIRIAEKYPDLAYVPYRKASELNQAHTALNNFDLDDFDDQATLDLLNQTFSSFSLEEEAMPIPERDADYLADIFADLDDEPDFLSQGGGIGEEPPVSLEDTAVPVRTQVINLAGANGQPISKKRIILFMGIVALVAAIFAALGLNWFGPQTEALEPTLVPAIVPTASLPPEPTSAPTSDPTIGMSDEEKSWFLTQQASTKTPK